MGGGSDQPFIYAPTSSHRVAYPYSDFNPKAVTQAHYESLRKEEEQRRNPPKKRDGPLINFNAHPDSYMVVSGQNVNYKPMSPRTKTMVVTLRWIQFALRVVQELGAIGLLVATICIRNVPGSVGWVIRIAPAADVVICLYAIYHLVRGAKVRPPGSSASYHFFALFMDAGLLPFYIFIALYSNNNYGMSSDDKDRWTSIFAGAGDTTIVLLATWVGCAAMAGLHILSGFLDIWLVVLFRAIAKLPPDMNPLEDNLTGRSQVQQKAKASKHKYKNSEVTLTGDSNQDYGKSRPGYLSGSTLGAEDEKYDKDDLSRPSTKEAEYSRPVPFSHSRMHSNSTFSPHNPDTARSSRQYFEDVNLYHQSQSARNSRNDVYNPSRPESSLSQPKRSTFVESLEDSPPPPPRSSARPTSSNYAASRTGTNVTDFAPMPTGVAPSTALVKSQQKDSLLNNNNWFVLSEDTPDNSPRQPLRMNPPTPEPPMVPPKTEYYPDPEQDEDEENVPLRQVINKSRAALAARSDNGNGNRRNSDLNRHLTVASNVTNSSSVYSESAPSLKTSSKPNGSPKAKYYGDLATATRGVRGYKSNDTLRSTGTIDAAMEDSSGMMALGDYGYAAPPPLPKKDRQPQRTPDRGGRVISRSGADIAENRSTQMRDRRDVSGKVAEEGRGGNRSSWWLAGSSRGQKAY